MTSLALYLLAIPALAFVGGFWLGTVRAKLKNDEKILERRK